MINRFYLLLLLFCIGCSKQKPDSTSDLFEEAKNLGSVSGKLEEASGLVASIANPGYLWSHNDSGNPADLFLIDQHAKIVLTVKLKGIKNRDFEDLSMGPGPDSTKNYLYLGDIGDNLAVYSEKIVYRFEEPKLGSDDKMEFANFETLVIHLSDGVRDTEALMIDPISRNLFLISKREDSVRLYEVPYPFSTQDTLMAQRVAILPYHKIVAGDISADGMEVLLKDYDHIYYWKRNAGESIVALLQKKAIELSYEREPQGESIAWTVTGDGFFTLSETVKGQRGKLYYYQRR